MNRLLISTLPVLLMVFTAGCATPARVPAGLAGERRQRVESMELPPPARPGGSSLATVRRVFELTNTGGEPVAIVGARIQIDTTVAFDDTGDWRLPRRVGPGEVIRLAMNVKVRRPPSRTAWMELLLDDGETVRLEVVVENVTFAAVR